jgi:hypothetical protein
VVEYLTSSLKTLDSVLQKKKEKKKEERKKRRKEGERERERYTLKKTTCTKTRGKRIWQSIYK